jgi:PIN domain nuclease of toxin-antitoxin system
MDLLLDTHIWLWSILGDSRLSSAVARELRSSRNQLWLSPISVWEALLLCEKGRLTPLEDAETWIEGAIGAVPLTQAPLTYEVALASRAVRLPHRDPSDRLIVATAKVYGLTLVTGDRRLIQARQAPVLANT